MTTIVTSAPDTAAGWLIGTPVEDATIALLPATTIFYFATPPSERSVRELRLPVLLPPGSLVTRAIATITARTAGLTPIGDVAAVRSPGADPTANSTTLVIDFQGLRTVSFIDAPVTIDGVARWDGAGFRAIDGTAATLAGGLSFAETQTERLEVTLGSAVAPAAMAADGTVAMTTPPSDVELLVEGEQVYLASGPVTGSDADGQVLTAEVDVTRPVAAAAAAGLTEVELLLRTRVPGRLAVACSPEVLVLHPATVDGDERRPLAFAAEGRHTVPLAVASAGSTGGTLADASLVRVALELAPVGPGRVVPAVGPALSTSPGGATGALVTVDADHVVTAALPPAVVDGMSSITALRVPLEVGPDGADVRGVLRRRPPGTASGGTAAPGTPGAGSGTSTTSSAEPGDVNAAGERIPGADLGPVALAPQTDPGWVTLPLPKALALRPGDQLAVELHVGRGRIGWPHCAPSDLGAAVPARVMPDGSTRAYTAVAGATTGTVPVHIEGEPRPDQPVAPVTLGVLGPGGSPVAEIPLSGTATVDVVLDPPIPHPVTLSVVANTAMAVTVGPALVGTP